MSDPLLRVVGDVHGKFAPFVRIIADSPCPVIQVGDMGFGFDDPTGEEMVGSIERSRLLWLRGNHDDPERCKAAKGYVGDWAALGDCFFVSGAFSKDKQERFLVNEPWWSNEQLSNPVFQAAFRAYKELKPRFMFSHDAPQQLLDRMFDPKEVKTHKPLDATLTSRWLDSFLNAHQPERWFFGHWHKTRRLTYRGTRFQCLAELNYVDVAA